MLSNPLYLCGARELVSSVAKRLGFSNEACCQISLAVDEALANVMRHGYKKACDQPIWMSIWPCCDQACDPAEACSCQDGQAEYTGIRIVIEDEADQVDPCEICSRDLDDVRPGGLGVHIIKEVMDQVVYEKREGVGMKLTLFKQLGIKDDTVSETQVHCPPRGTPRSVKDQSGKGSNA